MIKPDKPLKRVCLRFVPSPVNPDAESCRVRPIKDALAEVCRVTEYFDGTEFDLTIVLCHDLTRDFVNGIVSSAEGSRTPAIFMQRVNDTIPRELEDIIIGSGMCSIETWAYRSELVGSVGRKIGSLPDIHREENLFEAVAKDKAVAA